MKLYRVDKGKLVPIPGQSLSSEEQLEAWIAEDPSIIGLDDILVIGCQVVTDFGGRIDILAMDQEGALVILELKRDKTPRDTVAQALDYASWVTGLTTKRIHEIMSNKSGQRLEDAFRKRFDASLPKNLNNTHRMIIVASEFDAPSKRIVEYLAEEHGLNINTAFFRGFRENGQQFLATDWLMDQQEVTERAESCKGPPWSGYWYVNAGHGAGFRSWEDMRQFGFIAAGQGRRRSKQLEKLREGDPVYVYQSGKGYIGYGIVRSTSVKSRDFHLPDSNTLDPKELDEPAVLHDPDDNEMTDYMVGVDWVKTVSIDEAKTFAGAYARQNIVCRLNHPATLEFLATEFGSKNDARKQGETL